MTDRPPTSLSIGQTADVWPILHIDDDDDIRLIVAMSLALDPTLHVIGAASANEAMHILTDAAWPRPVGILIDYVMPGTDGIAMMQHIREHVELIDIPVIFLTAQVSRATNARILGSGARAVITKPFDPMTLARTVRDLLRL